MIKDRKVIVYASPDWPDIPYRASEFMAFFQKQLDRIPYEYMDEACIDIEATEYDGSPAIELEIHYKRLETLEEQKDRESKDKSRRDIASERKLAEFNKLKAELGL